MMNSSRKIQLGFTLIEIAIVLLIVTILLGYSVAMFSVQQGLKQYRQAESQMDSIIEHLVAFAQVNGRLPCPDTSANSVAPANSIDGEEDRVGINDCEAFFGFLPARTLGMNGKYDTAGVLIDPWGSGYGYAVSNDPGVINLDIDLVTPNGIRDEGIANVAPNLFICDDSAVPGNDLDCLAAASNEVVGANGGVAAVIISLGKDFEIPASSNIQAENLDDFHDGTNDKVYIFSPRRDDYDDIVKWLSTNLLFSKMVEADQLP
jgi:prepilin-type N-terminal cleavage/methylation domain-containing protein